MSVVNPDADDLQYTYDEYHRLLTIQNFNGEVYLRNGYDRYDRIIEQYVEGEGTFYFTYDGHCNYLIICIIIIGFGCTVGVGNAGYIALLVVSILPGMT